MFRNGVHVPCFASEELKRRLPMVTAVDESVGQVMDSTYHHNHRVRLARGLPVLNYLTL